MPYYVMCRLSDDAAGQPESLLTRHGVPVVFRTLAEAEATAEDLRHERHTRGAANYHYWVVDCPSGDHAGAETHAPPVQK
jgi:hypothetical protein